MQILDELREVGSQSLQSVAQSFASFLQLLGESLHHFEQSCSALLQALELRLLLVKHLMKTAKEFDLLALWNQMQLHMAKHILRAPQPQYCTLSCKSACCAASRKACLSKKAK